MSRFGSDVIVDLLIAHDVEYVWFNPGASVRGIHDSLVNGPEGAPQPILCLHEETAVSVAHGYSKAAGKPTVVLLHDVVGLQHAAMAIYNAWCDRVPIVVIGGTGPMSVVDRRPWIDWIHTALVQGNLVRDFVKWDDQPADLASVPESIDRAFQLAQADPPGPVYVCLDTSIQERQVKGADPADQYQPGPVPSPAGPEADAVGRLGSLLRDAELPVIVTDYAGLDPQSPDLLVAIAEATGAGVVDLGGRYNFPTRHPLAAPRSAVSDADVVLALEVDDLHGALLGMAIDDVGGRLVRRPGVRLIEAGTRHLRARSWSQDLQRTLPIHHRVTTAAAPLLRGLLQVLRGQPVVPEVVDRRAGVIRTQMSASRDRDLAEASRAASSDGIPPSRLAVELWRLIRELPWSLVHGDLSGWVHRIWEFDAEHRHIGWHGGGGLGYGPGASVGAAMAQPDRISINLQPDGDLLYAPQSLWTAARLELPLLTIVHNNRQYENTVQHAGALARQRGRDERNRHVGSAIDAPPIDMCGLARSMGLWAVGPVRTLSELESAVGEAIEVTRSGKPALVDVWTTGS